MCSIGQNDCLHQSLLSVLSIPSPRFLDGAQFTCAALKSHWRVVYHAAIHQWRQEAVGNRVSTPPGPPVDDRRPLAT